MSGGVLEAHTGPGALLLNHGFNVGMNVLPNHLISTETLQCSLKGEFVLSRCEIIA